MCVAYKIIIATQAEKVKSEKQIFMSVCYGISKIYWKMNKFQKNGENISCKWKNIKKSIDFFLVLW